MYFALKILLREGLTSGQSILLYRTSLGSWCNGSTTVFGTVCRGSNPCEPATFLAPQCIAELFLGLYDSPTFSMPSARRKSLERVCDGAVSIAQAEGVHYLGSEGDLILLEVGSGQYEFSRKM